MRARDVEELGVVGQDGDGLEGLAQALGEGGRKEGREGGKEVSNTI